MVEPRDDKGRVCIVCGRPLDYQEGVGWIHTLSSLPDETDHPVIPVLPEEAGEQVRARCDFCFADYPTWILPAEDWETIPEMSMSQGDWAACDACAACIQKNAWNRLLERVQVSYRARHGDLEPEVVEEVERAQKRLYRQLRKHATGALRRA